jgi:arginase
MDRVVFTSYFIGEHVPGLERLAASSWQRNECALTPADPQQRMVALYGRLAEKVAAIVNAGDRPVSFAGDCCSAIGVLAGLQRAGLEPTLIWLDAHGDFNTWETSPSGFLGGMPLAMLTGRGEQTLIAALDVRPLPDANVLLSDARDLDPAEREAVQASGLRHVPHFEELLRLPLPGGPLTLHLDVDVIDPRGAPAMEYPAPGGPTVELVGAFLQEVASSGQLAAVSISAWNPQKDGDGRTERAVMGLLQPFLGTPGRSTE